MHYSTYIERALDFAYKFEATSVTIEVDNGTLNMTVDEAIDEFGARDFSDSFVLRAIHFDN